MFKSKLLVVLVLLFTNSAIAQLTANFTALPTSGCSPLIVQFTNTSTGSPTSFFWDFGNGFNSTLQNPQATYFNGGTYTVKLVITRGVEKDSTIKVNYITVNPAPNVNFTTNDTLGCQPFSSNFTNTSNISSGGITSYFWDFGNGNTSTAANPSNVYNTSGVFNVQLQATSNAGCSKILTKTGYVVVNPKPDADFNFNVVGSCNLPVTVNFMNSTTPGGYTSTWDLGDGNNSTSNNLTHLYTAVGFYPVSLIVTSTQGCKDTVVKPVDITSVIQNVNFTKPDTVCAGNSFSITNNTAPTPTSVLWNFGDATSSTAINPVKTYSTAGTYSIKLISFQGVCKDSIVKNIVVVPKPSGNFMASDTLNCKAPFTVNYTALGLTGASNVTWFFGDGNSSNLPNPTYTYNNPGAYTVSLVLNGAANCTDTIIKPNYIRIVKPQLSITNLPDSGCAPLNKIPIYNLSFSSLVDSIKWDFGNGDIETSFSPSTTYSSTGNYTVKVIVYSKTGCADTFTYPNAIKVGIRPVPNFISNPRNACAETSIQFTDLTTSPPATDWFWNFGDGGTSILPNPVHLYTDTGFFNVTLVTGINGCRDSVIFPNYIYIKPPIARFNVSNNCDNPYEKVFENTSIGNITNAWNFGDANTSAAVNPIHTYASPGVYPVVLTVTNDTCSYTSTIIVRVVDEHPQFVATDTVLCKGTSTTFSLTNTILSNLSSVKVEFGDGDTARYGLSTDNIFPHIYRNSGVYTVRFITTDILGCLDTFVRQNYITVYGPTANFNIPIVNTCNNLPVTFTDLSLTDGLHSITNWQFNYGDGNIVNYTAPPFIHTYNTNGDYSVQLLVTDSYGCKDSLLRPNYVLNSRPLPNFKTIDTLTCPTKTVSFLDSSSLNVTNWLWSFGDGNSSILENPTHTYDSDGLYSVKLVVVDNLGCRDSITRPNYVRIVSPFASFTVNDSFATCPPLIVNFTNTSLNNISNNWLFGNGSLSNNLNPTNLYADAGNYIAQLIITSPGGCKDTVTKPININGPSGIFSYGPLSSCTPLTVNFTSTAINTTKWIWDFTDGTIITTLTPSAQHIYSRPGNYVPRLILEDAGGCQVPIVGLDTLKVFGVAGVIKANKFTICDSGMVAFTDSLVTNDNIVIKEWSFGSGSFFYGNNPTFYYNTTGTYNPQLIITTQAGCTDTLYLPTPVNVVRSPQINIVGDTSRCVPASFVLNGNIIFADTSALQWNWNWMGGSSNLQNPSAINSITAGSLPITVSVVNSLGCKDTASTVLETRPLPIVSAGPDTLICRATPKQLFATGASNYVWSPNFNLSCTNCANPFANPDSTFTYAVQGTSVFGCQATDSIRITVQQPFVLNVGPGDSLCLGEFAQLFATGGAIYSWSPSGGLNNPNIPNPIANPTSTTNYTVTARDDKNCFTFSRVVPITVYPRPVVNAGADIFTTAGTPQIIGATYSADVNKIRWIPDVFLNCNNCPQPTVTPLNSIKYRVEVENAGGCRSRDDVNVFVICEKENLYMPNTFSPNADGNNDVFYPRGTGIVRIKSFRIFNRWGQLMFERYNFLPNEATSGWDGTFKGTKLSPDVFVYTLEAYCSNEEGGIFKFNGNVTIIK
jgi:gliding motility-associated-like protein